MSVSDGWDDPAQPHRLLPAYWEDEFGQFHNELQDPIDPGGAAGRTGYGSARCRRGAASFLIQVDGN